MPHFSREDWLKNFSLEALDYNGQTLAVTQEEIERAYDGDSPAGGTNYWHAAGGPSSWLGVAIFGYVKQKYPAVDLAGRIAFTAHVLGISTESLVNLIHWHENYIQLHDGDYEYTVLE